MSSFSSCSHPRTRPAKLFIENTRKKARIKDEGDEGEGERKREGRREGWRKGRREEDKNSSHMRKKVKEAAFSS